MSFKEHIEIDKIKSIVSDIYQSVEAIEEFGHCCVHFSAEKDLKERSDKLQFLLKQCQEELDKFNDEMTEWYSY